MARKIGGRRRILGVARTAGVALTLIACGDGAIPRTDAPPGSAAPPHIVPTIDMVAKNLTATADLATPMPTMRSTSSTVWISHGGPLVDHMSFVDKLRGERCVVEPVGSVRQPFLRGEGILLRVSGCGLVRPTELQSFWYHTDDLGTDGLRAAEEDARGIDAQGQPRAMTVDWATAPHFFRKERAFVLYLGDDRAMLALLARLVGPQFAGRTD